MIVAHVCQHCDDMVSHASQRVIKVLRRSRVIEQPDPGVLSLTVRSHVGSAPLPPGGSFLDHGSSRLQEGSPWVNQLQACSQDSTFFVDPDRASTSSAALCGARRWIETTVQ